MYADAPLTQKISSLSCASACMVLGFARKNERKMRDCKCSPFSIPSETVDKKRTKRAEFLRFPALCAYCTMYSDGLIAAKIHALSCAAARIARVCALSEGEARGEKGRLSSHERSECEERVFKNPHSRYVTLRSNQAPFTKGCKKSPIPCR